MRDRREPGDDERHGFDRRPSHPSIRRRPAHGDHVGSIANDLELTVLAPEPGTWVMLVGGLGLLLGAQWMRRLGL